MHLYERLACLLDYPTAALPQQARACVEPTAAVCPEAAGLLGRFADWVEQSPLPRLEETYTGAFDLQAVCYPYVGYHLFGESYKRGTFMARLNKGYREKGFSAGNELPDHVAVVLRFLALAPDGDFSQALLREGLIPALDKMRAAFGDQSRNPYAGLIQALSLVLADKTEREANDG
jgi:nitrate reductase molybdenum cofactor assembly chaperone NarJ/NarW